METAADRRAAWTLRAAIYGLLAVVAVVAFLLRASAPEAADELPALSGTTDQGASVMLHMDGDRIASLDVASIGGRCRDGTRYAITWYPSTSQANVSYLRDDRGEEGTLFSIQERADERFPHPPNTRINIYMSGHLTADRRSVSGDVWFAADTPAGRCTSGAVRFSAQR